MLDFNSVAPPVAEPVAAIESVIVSASRSQTRLDEMPLHTTVLDQTDIAASSAQTLDQLLRNVQGLNFTGVPATQSDPTGHQTKMRGLGNAKVLVLLDGVPVNGRLTIAVGGSVVGPLPYITRSYALVTRAEGGRVALDLVVRAGTVFLVR